MTSSASKGADAAQDKVLSWADLAEEEDDSSKAYGLRLSYTKWRRRMQNLQQLPVKSDSSLRKSRARQSSEGTLINDATTSQDDEQETKAQNVQSHKGDSLTPSREVLEGLQSLEQGSNLDVTSLLIKKKKRVRSEVSNKENQAILPNSLVSCDFTQTQPPPSVCPPLGFDDVSDPQAIDALVDTLSKVLTRSLCQSNVKNLDIWGNEQDDNDEGIDQNSRQQRSGHGVDEETHSLGTVDDTVSVPSGVADTQLTTHVPSQPITQSSSQPLNLGANERPCSVSSLESASQQQQSHHYTDRRPFMDGGTVSPPMQKYYHSTGGGGAPPPPTHQQYMIRYDAEGTAVRTNGAGAGWAVSQSPAMFPQNPGDSPPASTLGFFPRSLSVPLAEHNQLAPPHFYPVRNPFMSAGYDDQCLVGGFPVSEWRRFFVYLATMDTHALLAYLSSQSGGAWCLDRGGGSGGSLIPTPPFTHTSIESPQQAAAAAFSFNPRASQPPPQTMHSPMTQNPPPPPPPSTSQPVGPSMNAPVACTTNSPPQMPNASASACRAPRRRAQSKPCRRQDIPPPSEGRFKQIARAKATPEYLLYIGHVKKEDRDVAAGDPMTPRVEGTTWREFQQDVRAWKRSLHRKAETLQMAS